MSNKTQPGIIPMYKSLSTLAALLGSLALSAPAHALNFKFSFSNTSSNVNGTVTGIIRGLQDNANGQQATEIELLTYPAGLGTNSKGDLVYSSTGGGWGALIKNSFDVSGGNIIASSSTFASSNSPNALFLNYVNFSNASLLTFNDTTLNVWTYNLPTYTRQVVPFEFSAEQGFLLGVPLFLGLRKLKKKRA